MPLHATHPTKTGRPARAGRVRPHARTAVLVACLAGLPAMGCGESTDPGGGSGKAQEAPASPAASASTGPSRSPSPTLPVPADGEDAQACADGTCEIRVAASTSVPLPARWGIGPLEVTAVDAETVSIVAPFTTSEFSSNGSCGATFTGPSASGPGRLNLNCRAGEKPVVNDMALEVVGILDENAVLRVRPVT